MTLLSSGAKDSVSTSFLYDHGDLIGARVRTGPLAPGDDESAVSLSIGTPKSSLGVHVDLRLTGPKGIQGE